MRSIYTLLYIRVHEFAEILGDTSDNEFPIYRTPRPSDPCVTAATGIVQNTDGRQRYAHVTKNSENCPW